MRLAVPVYWRWTPTVWVPFFRSPVSSTTKYGVLIAEVFDDVSARVVADCLGIPLGPGQQVLQAIRCGVSGMFGNRPAVFPWQVRQQSQDEGPCAASRFDPREAACDPAHQVIEHVQPVSGV